MDKKKQINKCNKCGFWNEDYGSCSCPSSDKWYACPIESEKPENVKVLKDYAEWSGKND